MQNFKNIFLQLLYDKNKSVEKNFYFFKIMYCIFSRKNYTFYGWSLTEDCVAKSV